MRYVIAMSIAFSFSGCTEQRSPIQPSRVSDPQDITAPASQPETVAQPFSPIQHPDLNSDVVTLTEIPKHTVSSDSSPPYSNEQIEELIASLASIESPDFGLSPTMSGHAFLPIEGQTIAGALLITDHKITSSDALKRLVTIGPIALPALLAHLDDAAPTKLKIDHGFGGMWFENELWSNPVNRKEQAVLQSRQRNTSDPFAGNQVNSYTVKVGDICLVAIGQITGRGYHTVRYQPTACIIINSPTHDPELCALIRAMWQSINPRQELFNSLLLDYATRGKFNGNSLDGWDVGSSLQIEAAMRMLYYFPTDCASVIADRIDQMDVTRTGSPINEPAGESELDAFMKREVANGVRTYDFIAAVVWSPHSSIVAAIKRVADRTDDEDIIRLVGQSR
jgi:hypothetical protein